ncbi:BIDIRECTIONAL SUGAR TRANSPORTER SWEET [Salix koriyanagi]|uniref:Bidirectional sugar transporter SWEET n=1 Tax=Salix koriyanagi TaxID=2511006 RepID=A0A9Q0PHU7_9ROSI|nr:BIDIRECTIONAL SUGAR TRANSPORTER SWEET [Salix koriyanagi]
MALHLTWVLGFGLLGNAISCLVCLAPLPTFYQICKKKTSQGFQSIPYVIALFSAMLWLYYALFKEDAILLITINSFTFFMEIGYIVMYLLYATKKDRILTFKLLLLFNVFGFGLICVLTRFLTQRQKRVQRKVIRTKSVEFMPFSLSFFLTLSAVMWFFYGFLKKDQFVAIPNILGLLFGILQMVLYMIYRNSKKVVVAEPKLQLELSEHVLDLEKLGATICSEIAIVIPRLNDGGDGITEDQNAKEQAKEIVKAMDVTKKL